MKRRPARAGLLPIRTKKPYRAAGPAERAVNTCGREKTHGPMSLCRKAPLSLPYHISSRPGLPPSSSRPGRRTYRPLDISCPADIYSFRGTLRGIFHKGIPMRMFPALSAALCLLLGGCLANPFARTPAPEEPVSAAPLSPVPQFIAMNNAGAQASIDDPAFGGMVDVMVEGSFTSASGRDCRRAVVSRPPHEAEIVILCRNGEAWELMPRVWGRGLD